MGQNAGIERQDANNFVRAMSDLKCGLDKIRKYYNKVYRENRIDRRKDS